MNRRMRTYYYAVLGGFGGLLAWQASDMLGLSFTGAFYLNVLLVGALVGLLIGLFIGITEGVLTRNPVLAIKAGLVGGLVGAAGGLGLVLGEFLFQKVGAGVFGRAIGWGAFGAMIGLAEGLVGRSEIWKPTLGGFIGGAVGGALLELARIRLDLVTGKAVGRSAGCGGPLTKRSGCAAYAAASTTARCARAAGAWPKCTTDGARNPSPL